MAISADWIAQNTATTGTGTITLGTALTGFIRLQDDSRITDGALVNYTIEDGNDREMGIGTYASAGGTLARTVVQRTLVSGTYDDTSPTAISLSGNAVVRCSAVADDRNFRGASLKMSAVQSISASTNTTITGWDTEEYDTSSFHDNGTNPERLTIPDGVSRVRLTLTGWWTTNTTGTLRIINIYKNGVIIGVNSRIVSSILRAPATLISPVFNVVAGDYFTAVVWHDATSSQDFGYDGSQMAANFTIEVIE